MKKILVPTDFSDCAGFAANAAIQIAKTTGAEVIFLHLTTVPVDWKNLPMDQDKLYPDITERVNKINTAMNVLVDQANLAGVKAGRAIHYNESISNIVSYIDANEVDLIVMGSHGAGALKEFFVGSTTQKVARLSPVPVLVIKNPIDEKSIKGIVVPSDFSEEIMGSFMSIVAFAKIIGAGIHLLFVNTPFNFTDTSSIRTQMGNYALHAPGIVETTNVCNAFEFEEGLTEFCEGNSNADIVAMITHGRKGFNRLYSGSLTESVINHLDMPVLSVRIEK